MRTAVIVTTALTLLAGCRGVPQDCLGAPEEPDAFVGFFADPSVGMLELNRAGAEAKYSGSLWTDFGPFPVTLIRDRNLAKGTVSYGDSSTAQLLTVESTPEGLILTVGDFRAPHPLRRYQSRTAYEKWFAAQGGYQATIEPATQP